MTSEEGLVLRSFPYKDRQKIITLFTPTRGLISLIVKGITQKKIHLLTLTSPFTQGEYHFHIGRSELYSFRDGSPIQTNHALRQRLPSIEAATLIAKALLDSQMPHKAAPNLYKLTLAYLAQIPQHENPTTLIASFLLKLLKYEGHLSLHPCTRCGQTASHLHLGESYCQSHAPVRAHPFTLQEWSVLQTLTEARSFSALKEASIEPTLYQTIQKIFQEKT